MCKAQVSLFYHFFKCSNRRPLLQQLPLLAPLRQCSTVGKVCKILFLESSFYVKYVCLIVSKCKDNDKISKLCYFYITKKRMYPK